MFVKINDDTKQGIPSLWITADVLENVKSCVEQSVIENNFNIIFSDTVISEFYSWILTNYPDGTAITRKFLTHIDCINPKWLGILCTLLIRIQDDDPGYITRIYHSLDVYVIDFNQSMVVGDKYNWCFFHELLDYIMGMLYGEFNPWDEPLDWTMEILYGHYSV